MLAVFLQEAYFHYLCKKKCNMAKGRESKPHIGIFGRRNSGKSSLINALCGQEIAIVSEVAGTTTDPVRKSIEIPLIGPAILIDTAGTDDTGELGQKRVQKSLAALKTVDLAILVITSNDFNQQEDQLIKAFRDEKVPFLVVHNKSDLQSLEASLKQYLETTYQAVVVDYSSLHPVNTNELVEAMQKVMPPTAYRSKSLLGDLLLPGQLVLLVTPIDAEAPEGRMILPQMQAVRDILDNECIAVVTTGHKLAALISRLQPQPALVVTDSQVFAMANAAVPPHIPLTSFSIMLARHKGDFDSYLKGTPKIGQLQQGERVLILESCTHHVVCDDIGREKLPRWLQNHTGLQLEFDVVAGLSQLPRPITDYALVIQCGGCVITPRQIKGRLQQALDAGVPVTNYGMAIAWIHGIYNRAMEPFLRGKLTGIIQD